MKNGSDIRRFEVAEGQDLEIYHSMLQDQAAFLEPLSQALADRWAELYLSTFGRGSFFSSERVGKIFQELTQIFIGCLKNKDIEVYFQNLEERGRTFSKFGVPFEEVIVCLHLFEEACLHLILESYPQRSRITQIARAMEELHGEGLAILANSYFQEAKSEMQKLTDSLQEEGNDLRRELSEIKESYFTYTRKELASMELILSGVNQKLRNRVNQHTRIQKVSDSLESETHLPKLLKTATEQLLALCPANSDVYFGFFGEQRKKIKLYNHLEKNAPECDLQKIFYFSELPAAFQDALYDQTRKSTHLKGFNEIPETLIEMVRLRNLREFLLIPVRQYQEAIGFILVCTHVEDFFSKQNYRFYQRVGQAVSRAIVNALLYNRVKKQDEFTSLIEEIDLRLTKKEQKESLTTTLDYCLGSLIDILGAERSSLMRYDDSKKELRVLAAKGFKVYPISGLPIRWGEGIAGLALKEAKIISIPKMREPMRVNGFSKMLGRPTLPEVRIKSLLCMPLVTGNKPLGVINISTINFYKSFEPSEIEMADNVVHRISDIVNRLSETEPAKELVRE